MLVELCMLFLLLGSMHVFAPASAPLINFVQSLDTCAFVPPAMLPNHAHHTCTAQKSRVKDAEHQTLEKKTILPDGGDFRLPNLDPFF